MAVLITSDVQLHNHAAFNYTLPNGRSSRLEDGINALEEIFRSAGAGDTIIILGDIFETQRSVETGVLHAFSDWVIKVTDSGVGLVLVVGNHDHYTRSGDVHSLAPFRGHRGVTVVDHEDIITINAGGDKRFALKAYTDSADEVLDFVRSSDADYLLLHQAVHGALSEDGSPFMGGISVGDLDYERFSAVFLGHFHKPQALVKNVFYVGSPYQVTPAESGDQKRFFRISQAGIESINVAGPNRFFKLPFADFFDSSKKGLTAVGYWIVYCSSPDQMESVRSIVKETGCRAEPVPVLKPKGSSKVVVEQLSWGAAIKSWLSSHDASHLADRALSRARLALNSTKG